MSYELREEKEPSLSIYKLILNHFATLCPYHLVTFCLRTSVPSQCSPLKRIVFQNGVVVIVLPLASNRQHFTT